MDFLEQCGGDPRSVAGLKAIHHSGETRLGWKPDWEARDARNTQEYVVFTNVKQT